MNKILLGLSGGVESAVAAQLLKEEGYSVTGCFLSLTKGSHPLSEAAESARSLAEYLGIDFVTADFTDRFEKEVTDYFISEYLSGRTPNPCVRCNPTVKIRSLLDTADKLGINMIATGHYALTCFSEKYNEKVLKAAPSKKDQSYFLSRLHPSQTERLIFPLGGFTSKDEVREKAVSLKLPNAKKADSQEICFIPDNDYQRFICENSSFVPEEGDFLDNNGNVLGRHTGIINYTVGQRKGLGAFGEPRYVKQINAKNNTVTLCKKNERYESSLTAEDISFAVNGFNEESFTADVKIRSTARAEKADITIKDGRMNIIFHSPVLAPTPGQTAAIYDGDTVIAAATII